MTYLRNTWYTAAWSDEVADKPLGRIILNERIVLFRGREGKVTAASDLCPHRFAPLHRGQLIDGEIECPYHNLRFNSAGKCTFNPDGDGIVPPGTKLKLFPTMERYRAIWIWMGDADKADPGLLPQFAFLEDPAYHSVLGRLHVRSNYRYITDNLMDQAHLRGVHRGSLYCEVISKAKTKLVRDPDGGIWANRLGVNGAPPPIFGMVWRNTRGEYPDTMDHWVDGRWHAPGVFLNHIGVTLHGEPREAGIGLQNTHFLTPETEKTTHYFWSTGRDFAVDNAELDAGLKAGAEHAFIQEDEVMLASLQEAMGDREFWSMNPALLQADIGAVAVRRELDRQISKEQAESAVPDLHREVAQLL